jgi:plasmid stabilization system protein ParE
MAAELVWLEQAEADLDSVGDHIAQSNPGAAA